MILLFWELFFIRAVHKETKEDLVFLHSKRVALKNVLHTIGVKILKPLYSNVI